MKHRITGLCFYASNGEKCQCGGARELHDSASTGDSFGAAIVTQWDSAQHTSEYPTDAFGELEFAGTRRRHSPVSCHSTRTQTRKIAFNRKRYRPYLNPFELSCSVNRN